MMIWIALFFLIPNLNCKEEHHYDSDNHKVVKTSNGSLCTYFASSRYSEPEYSLSNCTWYRSQACCKRTEVTSVFTGMIQLQSASSLCTNMLNYLMCFFCSPYQSEWIRKNQTVVCASFCRTIFQHCNSARYKGKYLGSAYTSGDEFCSGQNFYVVDAETHCFAYDPKVFGCSNRISLSISIVTLTLILLKLLLFY